MVIRLAVHAVHIEGEVQRRVLRQIFAAGLRLRAVILSAFNDSVSTDADLIGLVGGQVFGGNRGRARLRDLYGVAAHGQSHVEGGGALVKVVAVAGIDPIVTILLVDRHMVAVGAVHRAPFGPHHLVARRGQIHNGRGVGLVGVGIVDRRVKALAADGHQRSFRRPVRKGEGLFRHQERGHIVLAGGDQRAAVGKAEGNVVGIDHGILVHEVGRIALGTAQIGAQCVGRLFGGILHRTGQGVAALGQSQLLKRRNADALLVGEGQPACIDGIGAAVLQPQDGQTVRLAVVRRLLHVADARGVDGRVGIHLAVLGQPVDGKIDAVLRDRQGGLNIRLGDVVVKGQHDIRRLSRAGGDGDRRRGYAAPTRKHGGLPGKHRLTGFRILQGHGLYERLNAVIRPVPFGQALDPAELNVPAAASSEVGIDDIREQHPHPRIKESDVHADHRAEVDVHILERLLHALADADAPDGRGGLPADNEVDVPDIRTKTAN